MWDDERKVGVLNDFDLAKLESQVGASGQNNTGTLPFMALDLVSEKGLRGEIPRRYRQEAESFTWCLICLCLSTVKNKNGKNYTLEPHPLHKWFEDWETSVHFKIALQWHAYDGSNPSLAHPNARDLARVLHKHWVDRYREQFLERAVVPRQDIEELLCENVPDIPQEPHAYQEPDDCGVQSYDIGAQPSSDF